MPKLHLYIQSFLILTSVATKCVQTQKNPTIKINNGLVEGTIMSTVDDKKTFYAFRGIPYAEPPVGDLRFKPPIPAKPWNRTLLAHENSVDCVQGSYSNIIGTEDCLYISVYTPVIQPKTPLAVMVYIYGGTFLTGDTNYANYGPDFFIDQNVVVAMMNYRLGVFGFLSTGDLVAPGNNGLKDQNLALKWIQENIANFGGDPKKVTIWGESAGSVSVSYHMLSPLSNGLFRGAIMESGTSLCLWALSRQTITVAKYIAGQLLVETSSSQALVDGLRKIPYEKLQNVASVVDGVTTVIGSNPLAGLVFGPVQEPEHEGAFFTQKSHESLSKGQFNRVPSIIGYNSMEAARAKLTLLIKLYLLRYSIDVAAIVPKDMNIGFLESISVGMQISSYYWKIPTLLPFDIKGTYKFISDDQFVRPIRETAILLSKYVPAYLYEFEYEGLLGGVQKREVPGTVHSEELNYLFQRNLNSTSEDKIVRSRLVKLWANFAKYQNPTPHEDALFGNTSWPKGRQGGTSNLTYLGIGDELRVKVNPSHESMNFWKSLYTKNGNPPYDTY